MRGKSFFTLLVSAALLAGCRQPEQQKKAADTTRAVTPSNFLFTAQKIHFFSDTAAKDTFLLQVTGDDYLKAVVRFKIISAEGRVIFDERFSTLYLIDYGIMEGQPKSALPSDSVRSAYIQNRLKNFFAEKNFRRPAVAANAEYEEYYTSKTIFEELKARPKAVSFFYLLGKEDGRYIAWSEANKRTMLFYNCC